MSNGWSQLMSVWDWSVAEAGPPSKSLRAKLRPWGQTVELDAAVGVVPSVLVLLSWRADEAECHDLGSHLIECVVPPEDLSLRHRALNTLLSERMAGWVIVLLRVVERLRNASPRHRARFEKELARRLVALEQVKGADRVLTRRARAAMHW